MSVKLYKDAKGNYRKDNDILPAGQYVLVYNTDQSLVGLTPLAAGATGIGLQPLANIKDEAGDSYATVGDLEDALEGFFDIVLQHAGLDLVPAETLVYTDLTNVGEWYPVNGEFALSPTPKGFEIIEGVFTHTGKNQTTYIFGGSSDTKVSKNAELLYGLFVNGEVEPRALSRHTFSTPNAFSPMTISKTIELNYGDTIVVKAQSDTVSTRLTPASLDTTFGGTR